MDNNNFRKQVTELVVSNILTPGFRSDVEDIVKEYVKDNININVDTDALRQDIVEEVKEDVSRESIEEAVVETICDNFDTSDIESDVVERIVDNFDIDQICDSIIETLNSDRKFTEKVLNRTAELLSQSFKDSYHDIANILFDKILENPELRGAIIDNCSKLVAEKLLNSSTQESVDTIEYSQKKATECDSVMSINKALVEGELNLSTSGLPVNVTTLNVRRGI